MPVVSRTFSLFVEGAQGRRSRHLCRASRLASAHGATAAASIAVYGNVQGSIVVLLQHRHRHALPFLQLALLQLAFGVFWCWNAAVADHGFRECDRGSLIDV